MNLNNYTGMTLRQRIVNATLHTASHLVWSDEVFVTVTGVLKENDCSVHFNCLLNEDVVCPG